MQVYFMKVMVFGTFDPLHPGHLDFFAQARKFGDYLVVVIARDINVKKIKGHYPSLNERQRLAAARKVKIVSQAVLGDKKDYFKIIKKFQPAVICLGYDQRRGVVGLRRELKDLKISARVYRLKAHRPARYKSSIIKQNYKK
jgi:cytidyltransferase-like protein